ncbi:MAG: hypothetical protein ACRCUY_05615 [Thermoguttaceae bacterium]
MNIAKKINCCFLLLLCTILVGCGSNMNTVSGKVTFPDGTPLKKGVVVFDSAIFTAKDQLKNNGTYRLEVPTGQYKIYIALASEQDPTFVPPPNEPDAARYISLVAPQFAAASQTPLECNVTGKTKFDFAVQAPEK